MKEPNSEGMATATLAFRHAEPAGDRRPALAGILTFAGGIERSVANLDLTLSLVMARR
jgi:hypothetical protein